MIKKDLRKSIDQVEYADFLAHFPKSSSRRRAYSVLLSAIQNYAEKGIENTTYKHIAQSAEISRPLIFKYFRDYEDIFYHAVKLVRVHFQHFVVEAMKTQHGPKDMLGTYVLSTFEWVHAFPNHAGTLLLYLHRCSRNGRDRDLNTQFHETGRLRIASLIRLAESQGKARCADPEAAAGLIQTILAGALVNSVSVFISDQQAFRRDVQALCLTIAGFKPSE